MPQWTHDEMLEAMKQKIAASGLTQSEAAAQMGYSEGFLSKVLSGKEKITSRMAKWVVGRRVHVANLRIFRAA